jgi:hypothetical protein
MGWDGIIVHKLMHKSASRKSRGSLGTVSADRWDTAPCKTGHSARVSPLQDPLKMCNLLCEREFDDRALLPPSPGAVSEKERARARDERERGCSGDFHISTLACHLISSLLLFTRASFSPPSSLPPPHPHPLLRSRPGNGSKLCHPQLPVACTVLYCTVAASISVAPLRNATS